MFSERIQKRHSLWWKQASMMARWHRRREVRRMLRLDHPNHWRCCEFWQRRLSNKWNARVFAQAHGCRVPELYWHGRRTSRLPIESLPADYVIRPARGHSGRGIFVMAAGTELMSGRHYVNEQLRERLLEEFGLVAPVPLLVEEHIADEPGQCTLPIEYHCHVFGERIGAIEVARRLGRSDSMRNFYTAEWQPFPQRMRSHHPYGDAFEPPTCLNEILHCARALGVAYGTYVRVDFYAPPQGCVFGEFAATPGRGMHFTPYADAFFEQLWRETFGDQI